MGADVSVLNSRGETMFEYAVVNFYETSVVQLLSAGLSAESATAALWSALIRGATPDEVEHYVCQGADVSEPNSNLETMLYYAEARGYAENVLDATEVRMQGATSHTNRFRQSDNSRTHDARVRGPVWAYTFESRVLRRARRVQIGRAAKFRPCIRGLDRQS